MVNSSGSNSGVGPETKEEFAVQIEKFTEEINTSLETSVSIDDTQPVDLKYLSGLDHLITSSTSEISPKEMVEYSFLMISSKPEFRMVGEVEEIIGEEIQDICHANNWNLLVLRVHSDYLQIIVSVPSTMPPGIIIRIFREKTTKRIVESFEEIRCR